jgi:hypothetical protein
MNKSVPPNPVEGSTVTGRKSARARASSSGPPGTPTSSPPIATPSGERRSREHPVSISSFPSESALAHVLLGDELARAHTFSGVITILATCVLLALPMIASDPQLKVAVAVAIVIAAVTSFWV